MLKRLKNIGPGAMVAAAFIGPGTITTATISGASYGYSLLWAVVFSMISTIILQEMTARLGVAGQIGLGQAIREKIKNKTAFILTAILVISAIFIGNAAYESGNISGATLGFKGVFGEDSGVSSFLPLIVGVLAAVILLIGSFKLIERSLMILVGVIGLVFLVSAISLQPSLSKVLEGMFIPTVPNGSALMIVGLIGTTVVPYNLFLHAAACQKKWKSKEDLRASRFDSIFSILFGGLITMAILITAAAVLQSGGDADLQPSTLGASLQPLIGDWANIFLSFGFLAAGLSSAITAPLAASFAVSELLNWKESFKDLRFRIVWMLIILAGIIFASIPAWKPSAVILFAQIANGLLLPLIVLFLLIVMNDSKLLGKDKNGPLSNLLGSLVMLVAIGLAIKGIGSVFGVFG